MTLHHCEDINNVLNSIYSVTERGTSCIIIDLCEHLFTEVREEMADIHLGFNLDWIKERAANVSNEVKVKILPGICCKESGGVLELFFMLMKKS